jgi:hypothetical protein
MENGIVNEIFGRVHESSCIYGLEQEKEPGSEIKKKGGQG